jgi:hypothetical protein
MCGGHARSSFKTVCREGPLINLYNARPTWLDLAHKKLDAAVFAAYGWNPTTTDDVPRRPP